MTHIVPARTRRSFLLSFATLTYNSALVQLPNLLARASLSNEASNHAFPTPRMHPLLEKYDWKGPYAEMRSAKGALHSTDMCFAVRPSWLAGGRLLVRAPEDFVCSEFVLHCDHPSPTHPNWSSSGMTWKHSLAYMPSGSAYANVENGSLVAHGSVPDRARFSFRLTPVPDGLQIGLTLRNLSNFTLRDAAVRFCIIGYEAPEIGDKDLSRTLIPTEKGVQTLASLDPEIDKKVYAIKGGPEVREPQFGSLRSVSKVLASCGLILVQTVDRKHVVGIGFDSAQMIYTNTSNLCFHADPYFGDLAPQQEKRIRGTLYLLEATPQACLERFRKEVLKS